jgi:mono/diheme cytochrome c family protein
MRNPPLNLPHLPGRPSSRLLVSSLCSALALGLCCLIWLAPAPGTAAAGQTARGTGPMSERLRTATELFQRRCSNCHAADGTGSRIRARLPQMPDFTRRDWQTRRSDDELVATILEGKGSRMPAFVGNVTEETAQDLVSLIRTFDPAYEPAAAKGKAVSSDEFSKRFRSLEAQMEDLKKQFQGLSPEPRKP